MSYGVTMKRAEYYYLSLVSENCEEFVLAAKEGIHPDVIHEFGDILLLESIKKNDDNLVELIVANGMSINMQCRVSKTTALMSAIDRRYFDMVPQLISMGADVNIADNQGSTCLYSAIRANAYELVEYLLNHNAQCNIHDNYGTSPLACAASHGQVLTCKLFLQHNVDVNTQSKDEKITPLMCAIMNNHVNVVHLLIQNGADPLIPDVNNNNAFDLAKIMDNIRKPEPQNSMYRSLTQFSYKK